jgi:hypothetical protein
MRMTVYTTVQLCYFSLPLHLLNRRLGVGVHCLPSRMARRSPFTGRSDKLHTIWPW